MDNLEKALIIVVALGIVFGMAYYFSGGAVSPLQSIVPSGPAGGSAVMQGAPESWNVALDSITGPALLNGLGCGQSGGTVTVTAKSDFLCENPSVNDQYSYQLVSSTIQATSMRAGIVIRSPDNRPVLILGPVEHAGKLQVLLYPRDLHRDREREHLFARGPERSERNKVSFSSSPARPCLHERTDHVLRTEPPHMLEQRLLVKPVSWVRMLKRGLYRLLQPVPDSVRW